MFKASKILKKLEKKQPRLVQGEDGLTANEKEQNKLVAKYFEDMLTDKDLEEITQIPQIPKS